MADILSPSPYAYLDALTPAERQAEIARRQHQRREDWCDDARRARDYQARIAELEAALEPFKKAADNFNSMPVKDPESWFAYSGSQSHTEVMGAISVGDLRRARAALRK